VELDQKHGDQISVDKDLKYSQRFAALFVVVHYRLLVHQMFLLGSSERIVCSQSRASKVAAATSLKPPEMAPSLVSGARMQASAASSSLAPAAISLAAATRDRVEGGSM
jgi:hypothetical protein